MNDASLTGSKHKAENGAANPGHGIDRQLAGGDAPPQASEEQLAPPFQIFLDSQYAVSKDDTNSGYENDCVFQVPAHYCPDYQAFRVLLKGFTIPVSWYIMDSNSNTLALTYNSVNYTVTITPGNYNIRTFPAVFATAVATATGGSITCVLDSNTNKWTFTGAADFTFRSIAAGTTMFAFLGFKSYPSTDTTSYASTSKVRVSTLTVDFSGNNSIYVNTNFKTNNLGSNKATGLPSLPTIARVPVPVQNTGILNIDPSGYQTCELGDRQISTIKITLLDENGNKLQATLPWQMNIDVDFAWNSANRTFNSSSRTANTASKIKKRKTDHFANFDHAVKRHVGRGRGLDQQFAETQMYAGDDMEIDTTLDSVDLQEAADEAAPNDPLAAARAESIRQAGIAAQELSLKLKQRASETFMRRVKDDAERGRGSYEDSLKYGIPQPIISLSTVDPFRDRGVLREAAPFPTQQPTNVTDAGPGVQNP